LRWIVKRKRKEQQKHELHPLLISPTTRPDACLPTSRIQGVVPCMNTGPVDLASILYSTISNFYHPFLFFYRHSPLLWQNRIAPPISKSLLLQFIIPMPVLLSSESGRVKGGKGKGKGKGKKSKGRKDVFLLFSLSLLFLHTPPFPPAPKKLKDYNKVIISKTRRG